MKSGEAGLVIKTKNFIKHLEKIEEAYVDFLLKAGKLAKKYFGEEAIGIASFEEEDGFYSLKFEVEIPVGEIKPETIKIK